MQTTKHFIKEIGSLDAEVFRFLAAVNGLVVTITNEDEVNSLTYKFQESGDGTTWTDKSLPTGSTTSVSFVVGPNSTHTVRLTAGSFYRLIARGSVLSTIMLSYPTPSSISSGEPLTLLA